MMSLIFYGFYPQISGNFEFSNVQTFDLEDKMSLIDLLFLRNNYAAKPNDLSIPRLRFLT